MPQPIGVVVGEGDTVFVLSRQYEQILDVPWNKAATSAQVNRFTITEAAGEEEFLGRFSKYGDAEGELIWPSGIARDWRRQHVRRGRMDEQGVRLRQGWPNFSRSGDLRVAETAN